MGGSLNVFRHYRHNSVLKTRFIHAVIYGVVSGSGVVQMEILVIRIIKFDRLTLQYTATHCDTHKLSTPLFFVPCGSEPPTESYTSQEITLHHCTPA